MSDFAAEVAVGFLPQTATGTFNTTLAGISTSWTAAQGLLLGDSQQGIKESGLALTLGRGTRDKPFLGSTFTRSLSDFLAAEVATFTFAFPFCGNRATVSGAPADADAQALAGLEAVLQGAGMSGGAWAGASVGYQYVFASGLDPVSALVYVNGNRIQIRDCQCSLSIDLTPGDIPICTATIEGTVDAHAAGDVPATLTYGEQASVSAPVVEGVAHTWDIARGWSEATLSVTPTFEEIPDSNQTPAIRNRATGRETEWTATIFADDAHTEAKIYEYTQLINESQAIMDQISFLIGTVMADTLPAEAVGVIMPYPELVEMTPTVLGDQAAYEITTRARGDSGGSGNDELEFNFQ